MRKFGKLTALLLVLVMAMSLISCGKNNAQTQVVEKQGEGTVSEDDGKAPATSENTDEDKDAEVPEETAGNLLKIGLSSDSDYTFEDDSYAQIAYMTAEKVSVLSPGAKYQALAEKVKLFSDEAFKAVTDEYDGLKEAVVSDGAMDNEWFTPYFNTLSYSVFRADDKALSLLMHTAVHSGGAHPNHGVSSKVFDSVTGSFLAPSDVIADKDAFVSLIAQQAVANAGEDISDPSEYIGEAFDAGTLTWVLTYNGVDVYFSPYEIASYAAGYIITSVSFSEHPEVFNPKYMDVPTDYTYQISADSNVAVDTNGDGISEKLQIWNNFDDSSPDDMHELAIMKDGESFITDSEFYNFSYRLMVIRKDGKNYLAVDGSSYNGYHEMKIYDLSNGKKTDTLSGVAFNYYDDTDRYLSTTEATCDPALFTFVERVDALCTAFVTRDYRLDGGKMVPTSDVLRYDRSEMTFKNAVGLTVDVCDEEGNVSGTMDVHPGESFTFRFTDNSSYVIATLSDGTYVKLDMDNSDWPQHVNGMELEDVFPDAGFAG